MVNKARRREIKFKIEDMLDKKVEKLENRLTKVKDEAWITKEFKTTSQK